MTDDRTTGALRSRDESSPPQATGGGEWQCRFDDWITELDEEVIQGEFGYERGEFTVYPDAWRALFDGGLTPRQAWQRALDSFAKERKEREAARDANYARIVAEDAAAVERQAKAER